MKIYFQPWLCAMLFVTVCTLNMPAADELADASLRLANGTVFEGTLLEVTPEGLVIQGAKGKYTAAWKYLSAGTRFRYERSMLAAQAAAAQKAAADKAAAAKTAATKAPETNAVGVVSNKPPVKK